MPHSTGLTHANVRIDEGSQVLAWLHVAHAQDEAITRAIAGAHGRQSRLVLYVPKHGIGRARRLRDAGCGLTLGTDSNAIIEPLEEARAVELDERLSTGIRGRHAPEDLLQAATQSGYESLGWPEGGAIREGALADLVAVNRKSVRLAGAPPEDAVQALVFAGASADVSDVLVGGRFVVQDGAHTSLDVAQEISNAIAGLDP